MFLARKVTRAKWREAEGLSPGEMSADAVTIDLRTTGNALSFWKCGGGTQPEVDEAVLALASGAQRVDVMDVVWIAYDDLETDGLSLRDSDGRTPVAELASTHVDLVDLDYVRLGRLGRVASRVASAISEGRFCRLTKSRVLAILSGAVDQRRLDPSLLEDGVRRAIDSG